MLVVIHGQWAWYLSEMVSLGVTDPAITKPNELMKTVEVSLLLSIIFEQVQA